MEQLSSMKQCSKRKRFCIKYYAGKNVVGERHENEDMITIAEHLPHNEMKTMDKREYAAAWLSKRNFLFLAMFDPYIEPPDFMKPPDWKNLLPVQSETGVDSDRESSPEREFEEGELRGCMQTSPSNAKIRWIPIYAKADLDNSTVPKPRSDKCRPFKANTSTIKNRQLENGIVASNDLQKQLNVDKAEHSAESIRHNTTCGDDPDNLVNCDFCGVCFAGQFRYQFLAYHKKCKHKRTRRYQCYKCDRSFRSPRYLKAHIVAIHKRCSRSSCQRCGRSFGLASNLKRHVEAVHEKLKPYQCSVCNRNFGHSQNLKRHVRTVHNQLKPFECNHCKKRFLRFDSIGNHIRKFH